MQLTSEQRNFLVTNYLRTRSFNKILQLFEQSFPDRVSPTRITIWKNAIKFKTEGSSLIINKDRSSHRQTERTQENINLQEKLIEDARIAARKNSFDINKEYI